MVAEQFHYKSQDSLVSVWKINTGSILCIFCVVFLGLKLKWFRAQLKFDSTSKNKKSEDTVQGIGYKINSNLEDFQSYKTTSEFSIPIDPKQQTNENNPIKYENSLTTFNKILTNENVSSNTLSESENIKFYNEKKSRETQIKELLNKKQVKIQTKDQKVTNTEVINNNKFETNATNITYENISIKNETVQEHKEIQQIINENETVETKVTFVKNKATKQIKKQEEIEIEETEVEPFQTSFQMRNPLAKHNVVMPDETEDDWEIKIVDEKPKAQMNIYEVDKYKEMHLMNNKNKSTLISDTTYSSQAASIFFGSQSQEPPSSPPPPIPRKFLEDQDDLSISSQTSA